MRNPKSKYCQILNKSLPAGRQVKIPNSKIFGFAFWFCLFTFSFLLSLFAQEAYVYDSGGRRDPFMPLITSDGRLLQIGTKTRSGDVKLEGIIFDKGGSSLAIINGSVVAEGESADEIKITKILDNKIIFEKDGKVFEQELDQGGEK